MLFSLHLLDLLFFWKTTKLLGRKYLLTYLDLIS